MTSIKMVWKLVLSTIGLSFWAAGSACATTHYVAESTLHVISVPKPVEKLPRKDCSLPEARKRLGDAYPAEFMAAAFDAPPYDKIFKQEFGGEKPRMYQGIVFADATIKNYMSKNWSRTFQPDSRLEYVANGGIDSVVAIEGRLFPNGYPGPLKNLYELNFFAFLETAPGRVNTTNVPESIEYLKKFRSGKTLQKFQPLTGCSIDREVDGYRILNTFTVADSALSNENKARCLLTALLVHSGFSNADYVFKSDFYIQKTNGLFGFGLNTGNSSYIYSSRGSSIVVGGSTQCSAAEHVAELEKLTCESTKETLERMKNQPKSLKNPEYIKRCLKIGVDLRGVIRDAD